MKRPVIHYGRPPYHFWLALFFTLPSFFLPFLLAISGFVLPNSTGAFADFYASCQRQAESIFTLSVITSLISLVFFRQTKKIDKTHLGVLRASCLANLLNLAVFFLLLWMAYQFQLVNWARPAS